MQTEDCRVPYANSLPKISAQVVKSQGSGWGYLLCSSETVFFLLVVYEEIRNIKGASVTLLSYMHDGPNAGTTTAFFYSIPKNIHD
jgi:hypothetical protein